MGEKNERNDGGDWSVGDKKERIMIGGLHLIEVYTNDEEDILGKFISRLDTGKYMFNFF